MSETGVHSQEWVDKIEDLVRQAESIADPKACTITIDLLRAVLEFHSAALERVLDLVFEADPAGGAAVIERIAADDLASSMLLLHGLHPDDVETRVNRAVGKLTDMFATLGATLSLISIDEDTVRLQFESQRNWSATPVKASVEKAIFQAAPEIKSVVLDGIKEAPVNGFVPVSDLLAGIRV